MVTVMGASGRVGRQITNLLLDSGEPVRVLGRCAEQLAGLANRGAVVMTGDAADSRFLAEAFQGADAAFTLIAEDLHASDFRRHQNVEGDAIATAIRDSGLTHVVFLSSLGADLPRGTGPAVGLYTHEERLRRLSNTSVLILRAAYLFEDFCDSLDFIKQHRVHPGPIVPTLEVPMIDSRDIADAATRALRLRDWQGLVVRELLGERDLAFGEATHILGERIGQPDLPYVQLNYPDFIRSLVERGMSANMAALYAERARAINEGRIKSLEGRQPANTTATRFEVFVDSLIDACATL